MLFPTCIHTTTDFSLDIIDDLKEKSFFVEKEYGSSRSNSLNVDSTHLTVAPFLQTIKPFDVLRDRINQKILEFCQELGIEEKLHMNNMWFNISDKGDFNFPHSHPASVISGVYYIESSGDSNLVFYNNTYLVNNFVCSVREKENMYSYSDVSFPCQKGSLYLWPGHVIHGNPAQEKEGMKIALSFNTRLVTDGL